MLTNLLRFGTTPGREEVLLRGQIGAEIRSYVGRFANGVTRAPMHGPRLTKSRNRGQPVEPGKKVAVTLENRAAESAERSV